MAEKNQAKCSYDAFIFIWSVEKKKRQLTENCLLQIVKSNSEKSLTDLEG